MSSKLKILALIFLVILASCGGGSSGGSSGGSDDSSVATTVSSDSKQLSNDPAPDATNQSNQFTTDIDFIYKDDERFDLRGVVYVVGEPGYLPWEIEVMPDLPAILKARIDTDLADIKALGANTIRFWGAPAYAYQSLKALGDLNILQTIWFDGEAEDFHNEAFKSASKDYIKTVVDRVYSTYPDNNPPIVAFLVGNELSETSILSTNQAHPDITAFSGNHFFATEINATEAFIAEMADYLRTYELETYNKASLISYANEIRTVHLIDTPFLDFRSQNAYSYAVPYYRPQTQLGSSSGTIYQGWIEELKYMHSSLPLLITETGLSVSPNAEHSGPPNYGYGGNSEVEQKTGIAQNLQDIDGAAVNIAGVIIHEYMDAWWKFGLEDSYTQDPNDIEEWFGMVRIVEDNGVYITEPRPVYWEVQSLWDN